MLIATNYQILRGLRANGRNHGTPVAGKPIRVATLINEAKFKELGGALIHNDTVFLEDRYHDWNYVSGNLLYYTRVAEVADVVVVFEMETR